MPVTSISGSYFKAKEHKNSYLLLSSSGIVIVSKDAPLELNSITFTGVFTDFYFPNNTSYFYLATSGSGLLRCDLPETLELGQNLSGSLSPFKSYPQIHSNSISCIDGIKDTIYLGSASGIQVLSGNVSYSSYTYPNIVDVKVSLSGDVYYCGSFGLAYKQGPVTSSWVSPTSVLTTGTVPNLLTMQINEIDFINTGTEKIIALATYSGVSVINQKTPISGSSILHLTSGSLCYSVELQKGSTISGGSLVFGGLNTGLQTINLNTHLQEHILSTPTLETNTIKDFS